VNGLASLRPDPGGASGLQTGALQLAVRTYESLTGPTSTTRFLDGATPDSDGDRVCLADNVSEFVEDLFVDGM
jgi:hypothetical protein